MRVYAAVARTIPDLTDMLELLYDANAKNVLWAHVSGIGYLITYNHDSNLLPV